MYRKIVIGASVAGILAFAMPALALESSTSLKATSKVSTKTFDVAKAACVGTAVAAREASLGVAIANNSAAINAAYTARATALAGAYTKTDAASIKAAVKDAWMNFNASLRVAKKQWQTSRTTAWSAFKKASAECKAPAVPSDAANINSEAAGS